MTKRSPSPTTPTSACRRRCSPRRWLVPTGPSTRCVPAPSWSTRNRILGTAPALRRRLTHRNRLGPHRRQVHDPGHDRPAHRHHRHRSSVLEVEMEPQGVVAHDDCEMSAGCLRTQGGTGSEWRRGERRRLLRPTGGRRDAVWEITEPDLAPIALGAAVLGTGGGGNPYLGRLRVLQVLRTGGRVRVIEPTRSLTTTCWCRRGHGFADGQSRKARRR